MGWNIEVAAVRTNELADSVPDVFAPTSTTMGFEDATSVMRGPNLCAAQVGEWAVVIDVDCRLSGTPDYLSEASAATDLHLVRVADQPVILHYREGRQVMGARGLAASLEVTPCDYEDGETCAMKHLHETTGLTFDDGSLWAAKFTLFTID
jgi:hypothetical protein